MSVSRRGITKGAVATAGTAVAYTTPAVRAMKVAQAQGSPPPGGGGTLPRPITIVDTLGIAGTTTVFELRNISFECSPLTFPDPSTGVGQQTRGPQFTLERPIILTEIGAYLSHYCGDQECPTGDPFIVDVHPATVEGKPNPTVKLASFPLSNDQERAIRYESALIHLRLEAGTYFALFRPSGGGTGTGCLLRKAQTPSLVFEPPSIPLGAVVTTFVGPSPDPNVSTFVYSGPAAVRILGLAQ